MAKYKKKRARELRHDKFRDTTMGLVDRAAHRMEGKGRKFLYALGALAVIGLLIWGITAWRGNKANEARLALGRAIKVAETPSLQCLLPGSTAPSFRTEKSARKGRRRVSESGCQLRWHNGRARALFCRTHQLLLDRAKAWRNSTRSPEALTGKFLRRQNSLSLQAKEGDANMTMAATLYSELIKQGSTLSHQDKAKPAPGIGL